MQSHGQEMPKILPGIGDIAGFYEGYILDLWGVLHNGIEPFPDTIPTLVEMKRSKRNIWLLSNAPRRAAAVAAFLSDMGITPDMYDGIMTSGEATFHAMADRYLAQWGKRCLHIGPAHDLPLLEGLDVDLVEDPADADFLLCTGVRHSADTAEPYRELLAAAAEQNIPFLCANPDRIVHVGDHLVLCPGTFADIYMEMDGQVTWFGKPYRQVYSHCLGAMPGQKVLAIGDGMPTDIAGATGAGIDSMLITGGIHRTELPIDDFSPDAQNRIYEFFSGFPYRPRYLAEKLTW
ncbi:MAG TPA: TIGR01459 family HAD-type hydrolase [Alphaproteobacteria bacterium]|nr:TIGR01459 family HAD-type hydrolase [Alphaproteobacteria bacterium]